MITFLPYPDFVKSAKCLDYRRLGKQRVEAWQILYELLTDNKHANWPQNKMWQGYEDLLGYYMNCMIAEWVYRGYRNNIITHQLPMEMALTNNIEKHYAPKWLGNEKLHSSHRAALLYKDFKYYSQFGWTEEPKIDYYWPVR